LAILHAALRLPSKEACSINSMKLFKADTIVQGKASGPALVSRDRIAFQGCVHYQRGIFTGGMVELIGKSFAGAVLIFPFSKGSTLWAIAFDLACRSGNAPAAIVNFTRDSFVTLSCIMQDVPLVQISDESILEQVRNGDTVTVDADRGEVIASTSS
jgi:predicted aconitase with swiveling domain